MKKIYKHDLTRVLKFLDETRQQITQRGREKIDATEGGRQYNQLESISYYPSGIEIQCANPGYDGLDCVAVRLTLDELCMTHEEWNVHIFKIMKDVEEQKEAKRKSEKEAHQGRKRAKYIKLKKEFGDD